VRPVGEERWQNVGQLLVNDSLEGTLEVRVPHDRFDVTVSAENNGDVSDPSEFIVMRGQMRSRSRSALDFGDARIGGPTPSSVAHVPVPSSMG
jgi:hypothetical protein